MIIINNYQMLEAEQKCLVSGYDLMKRAGKAVFDYLTKKYARQRVLIICGGGNNGGDGFVLAKMLRDSKWNVDVAVPQRFSPKKQEVLLAIKDFGMSDFLTLNRKMFSSYELVVDALFGAGLSGDVLGEFGAIFDALNSSNCSVLSIDIPSGINGNTGNIMGSAIQANDTVTFSAMKVCHVLHSGKSYSGNVVVSDIGVDVSEYVARVNDVDLWRSFLKCQNVLFNKYDRGYVAVLGGEMVGAAKLAAYTALKTFAGIVSIACNEDRFLLYSSDLMSVMLKSKSNVFCDNRVNAFVVGVGLGCSAESEADTLKCIEKHNCVIDADSISVFRDNPDVLFSHIRKYGSNIVITPHLGEFNRIFSFGVDKISSVKNASKISNAVVVLKGDDTVIASPDGRVVVNCNASPNLATAGSGDVLSGLIGGLIASGVDAFNSACAGVWIHAEAGRNLGYGMISEELPDAVRNIIRSLL